MNRILKHIALLSGACALLFSCKIQEESPVHGEEINFTASIGAFQTRATDIAFEEGDEIALTCGYAPGVTTKLVYNGNSLVPESPVYWPVEATEYDNVPFYAIYPFQESAYLPDGISFCVNSDQSTHRLYTESDVMVSIVRPSIKDGNTVHLPFVHKFSKIILQIDNQIGKKINEVYLGNVYGKTRVEDQTGSYFLEGTRGTIKAGEVRLNDGTRAWALIIPPQYSQPVLMVTTADGEQYTYKVPQEVEFNAGHRYKADIVIDSESISTDFTKDVIEWTDNKDIEFGKGGDDPQPVKSWGIVGSMRESDWQYDQELCNDGNGGLYGAFYAEEGDEFKLRADQSWTVNLGLDNSEKLFNKSDYNVYVKLSQDAGNIKIPFTSIWEVTFYPEENSLWIRPASVYSSWSLIGTVQGSNWDTDFEMTPTVLSFSDGNPIAAFKVQFNYNTGEEFKIRYNREWYYNYGSYDQDGYMDTGSFYDALRGGYNMKLTESGTFNLYYLPTYQLFFVTKVQGSGAGTIQDVIDGEDGKPFTVKGKVGSLSNTSYGNWYLVDETGRSLSIYGTVDSEGHFPKDTPNGWFSYDFGLMPGDGVTVTGVKKTYNGEPELVNVTLSYIEKEPIALMPDYMSANNGAGTVTFMVRSTDNLNFGLESEAGWISNIQFSFYNDDWYVCNFDFDANTDTEARTAILKFIHETEDQYTVCFVLDQEAASVPEVTLMDFAQEFVKGLEVWEEVVGNVDADGARNQNSSKGAWKNVHFIPIDPNPNSDYINYGNNQYDMSLWGNYVWWLNVKGTTYSSSQAWEMAIRGLLDMVTSEGQAFLETMDSRNKAYTLADGLPMSQIAIPTPSADNKWGKHPWYEYDNTVKDNGQEVTEVDVNFMVKVGAWHVVRSFIKTSANTSPLGMIGNFQEFGTSTSTLNLGNYVGYISPMRELLVLMRIYKYLLDNGIDSNVYSALQGQMFDFDLYHQELLAGKGSADSPYLLADAADMKNIKATLVSGDIRHYRMVADIDMSSVTDWEPLNAESPYDRQIVFDGDGHTISNFSCSYSSYPSFFGVLYGDCFNVTFRNAVINSSTKGCGILGGYGGTTGKPCYVERVHVQGTITNSTGANCGGMFGTAREAVIYACSAEVDITSGGQLVGGLFGTDAGNGVQVSDCWTSGSIVSTASIAGGICGDLVGTGSSIVNCYSTASVTTQFIFGGIAGRACAGQKTNATNCEGKEPGNHIENCIAWNTLLASNCSDESEHYSSGAIVGGTAIKNYLSGCIRKPDLAFQDCPGNAANGGYDLFDQNDASPDTPLVKGAGTYAYAYHGKAAQQGETLSQVAQRIGWDARIWDFSEDLPTLKN